MNNYNWFTKSLTSIGFISGTFTALILSSCGEGSLYPTKTQEAPKPDNTTSSQTAHQTITTPASENNCSITTTPGKQISPNFGIAYGKGPVYVVFGADSAVLPGSPLYYGDAAETNGKKGMKVLWAIDKNYNGLVTVRGHQLDGPNELVFYRDRREIKEMQLDTAKGGTTPSGWPFWPSTILIPAPGCYAFEVTAQDFSYSIIFKAVDKKP